MVPQRLVLRSGDPSSHGRADPRLVAFVHCNGSATRFSGDRAQSALRHSYLCLVFATSGARRRAIALHSLDAIVGLLFSAILVFAVSCNEIGSGFARVVRPVALASYSIYLVIH